MVKYWKDSEGNIWYQAQAVQEGAKYLTLTKISQSGTVREMVAKGVADFASKDFPTTVDPKGFDYHLWYRADK